MSAQRPSKQPGRAPVPVDSHVHLHPMFDRDGFLDAALANFRTASPGAEPAGVLMLVEVDGVNAFEELRAGTEDLTGWHIEPTAENVTALARNRQGATLVLAAGRQIATAERLEVLICGAKPTDLDGLPFDRVLQRALEMEGTLVTVPWGFGKWWGGRGELVRRAIERHGRRMFLGDNGGRPRLSPAPPLFRRAAAKGVRVLPGSDPLPMAFEEERVGTYGFLCQGRVHYDQPFASVRDFVHAQSAQPPTYGRRVGWTRFIRSQTLLRLGGRRDANREITAGEVAS